MSDKEIVPVEVVEYDGSSDNIEVRIVGEKLSNILWWSSSRIMGLYVGRLVCSKALVDGDYFGKKINN